MQKEKILTVLFSLLISFSAFCGGTKETYTKNIALFIPGTLSGSPVYEMLYAGVEQAVTEYKHTQTANLTVIEAGTNQAEWGKKLTVLSSQKKYDVIISSNPSMPDFAAETLKSFPTQKFIFLDAYAQGNKNIATIQYNQREEAYLAGYAAALVTTASNIKDPNEKQVLTYANSDLKIALIAAQEYPVMNNVILPAVIEGAHAINSNISVDFRIIGNWYDATKGAEISKSLYDNGVDVIIPIAGGANQGIITAAQQYGFYISWFDDNGFTKAPGYVISSSVMQQKKMAYEQTKLFLEDKTEYGIPKTVGISDGYVQYVLDDKTFINTVPEVIRTKMNNVYTQIKSGELLLPPSTM